MLILALDTTTRGGSVALARDGDVLDVLAGDPSVSHGRRLPGEIVEILGRHRLAVGEVEVYGVAAGPGSFTGLRVGIATIQGLALVTSRPVVAVPTLDAIATAAATSQPLIRPGHLVGAWLDGQRGEVFSCLYRVGPPAPGSSVPVGFEVVLEPGVGSPAETAAPLERARGGDALWLAGDGAVRYADEVRSRLQPDAILPVPPLAPAVARLAWDRFRAGGAVTPHAIQPIYLRRPDAELARARRETQPVGDS